MPGATPVNYLRMIPAEQQAKYFGDTGDYASFGVFGEGTCFFHSVLAAMNYKDYLARSDKEKKELAYEFRCKLKKTYDSKAHKAHACSSVAPRKFDDVVADFCDKSAWADETMIRHMASLLGINMIFVDDESDAIYCGVRGKEPFKVTTIVVRWVSKSHFEPFFRKQAVDRKRRRTAIRGIFDPVNDAQDMAMVLHLMREYARQCKT